MEHDTLIFISLCAQRLQILSALLLLIGAIGASTLYMPSQKQSAMAELSMLRWHPQGDTQYFFGLTRVVEQLREENPDPGSIGGDDVDDEFNWYFSAWAYKDCVNDDDNLGSSDLCQTCYDAGIEVMGLLFVPIAILLVYEFLIPLVIFTLERLPFQSAWWKLLPLVYIVDHTWYEDEAKKGHSKELNARETPWRFYQTERCNTGAFRVFRLFHVVFPALVMFLLWGSLGAFAPCVDIIKSTYDDGDSMYPGAGYLLIISAGCILGITMPMKAFLAYYSVREMEENKKKLELYRLEPAEDEERATFGADPPASPGIVQTSV